MKNNDTIIMIIILLAIYLLFVKKGTKAIYREIDETRSLNPTVYTSGSNSAIPVNVPNIIISTPQEKDVISGINSKVVQSNELKGIIENAAKNEKLGLIGSGDVTISNGNTGTIKATPTETGAIITPAFQPNSFDFIPRLN